MTDPRGVRNNNPGNIEYTGTRWRGLEDKPSDGRFCRFRAPEYGIRAIARILRTYKERYGVKTVWDAISKWAPKVENPTDEYANFVARIVGVDIHKDIDLTDETTAAKVIEGIIRFENGGTLYFSDLILKGIQLEKGNV